MHKDGHICQKCAINCGIVGNVSNENITKYKNLCGVKSISNSVQWLARYRIAALISIGRLCSLSWVKPNARKSGSWAGWPVFASCKVYYGHRWTRSKIPATLACYFNDIVQSRRLHENDFNRKTKDRFVCLYLNFLNSKTIHRILTTTAIHEQEGRCEDKIHS